MRDRRDLGDAGGMSPSSAEVSAPGTVGARPPGNRRFFPALGLPPLPPDAGRPGLRASAQRIRDYARNRFFRIFPLFWFILIVTAIVPGMYGAFTGNWWVYFGLLQNLPIVFPDGECGDQPFRCVHPPSWTLGIEVMFYFLLPFFAAGMTMIQNRFRSTPSDGFFSAG